MAPARKKTKTQRVVDSNSAVNSGATTSSLQHPVSSKPAAAQQHHRVPNHSSSSSSGNSTSKQTSSFAASSAPVVSSRPKRHAEKKKYDDSEDDKPQHLTVKRVKKKKGAGVKRGWNWIVCRDWHPEMLVSQPFSLIMLLPPLSFSPHSVWFLQFVFVCCGDRIYSLFRVYLFFELCYEPERQIDMQQIYPHPYISRAVDQLQQHHSNSCSAVL